VSQLRPSKTTVISASLLLISLAVLVPMAIGQSSPSAFNDDSDSTSNQFNQQETQPGGDSQNNPSQQSFNDDAETQTGSNRFNDDGSSSETRVQQSSDQSPPSSSGSGPPEPSQFNDDENESGPPEPSQFNDDGSVSQSDSGPPEPSQFNDDENESGPPEPSRFNDDQNESGPPEPSQFNDDPEEDTPPEEQDFEPGTQQEGDEPDGGDTQLGDAPEVVIGGNDTEEPQNQTLLELTSVSAPSQVQPGQEFEVCAQIDSNEPATVTLFRNGEELGQTQGTGEVCFTTSYNFAGSYEYVVVAEVGDQSAEGSTSVQIGSVETNGDNVNQTPEQQVTGGFFSGLGNNFIGRLIVSILAGLGIVAGIFLA